MDPAVQQLFNFYRDMPFSRKLVLAVVTLIVAGGFAVMFFLANQTVYQTLYSDLSANDASEITSVLKEQNIPYKLLNNGSKIQVPADMVYDVRLTLAGSGLPKGGGVGFEIFDKSEFGTTKFVQNLNYKRALQGELARTISEIQEVVSARVMVVLPKESVFIEESKPASASVLLELNGSISKEKIAAIENLVASSVENLSTNQITVVDTKGKILSKKREADDFVGADTKLEYKMAFEKNLASRIQSMLEAIVGTGKAIVRVTADMDFDRVDLSEETYDPMEKAIRSRQVTTSSSQKPGTEGQISSVNPVTPETTGQTGMQSGGASNNQKSETINYELSRTMRRTVSSAGEVTRVSVAAVLDGKYETVTDEEGNTSRKFVPRTDEELTNFENIVKNAMGYSVDRNDQITVKSFPFSYMQEMDQTEAPAAPLWQELMAEYGRSAANGLLILLVFLFIIIPLLRSLKTIRTTAMQSLPAPGSGGAQGALEDGEERQALSAPAGGTPKAQAVQLASGNVDQTASLMRSWASES
ncbi:MAG: flagellar basal-body MS-ring/collar protein FliF [Thermodesulfobacteriota bacterium]|nr:flagellar basal-body MS-ring/collar protein FliF [Thermodesulfobacteriota bacterium]